MNDHHTFRDHRMEAARQTGDGTATGRGWCFAPELDEVEPMWVRVIKSVAFGLFNPASLFAIVLLGVSVWLLVEFG